METLRPFTSTPRTELFKIQASFQAVSASQVHIDFHISGPLEQILWPDPHLIEARQDELWKHTCLEAFFSSSATAEAPYTEINCAPNGLWNAYSFSSYRQGMSPALHITVRLKERTARQDHAHFLIEVNSSVPLQTGTWGLTAVVEFQDGEKSYWALNHPRETADFHDKRGWKTES